MKWKSKPNSLHTGLRTCAALQSGVCMRHNTRSSSARSPTQCDDDDDNNDDVDVARSQCKFWRGGSCRRRQNELTWSAAAMTAFVRDPRGQPHRGPRAARLISTDWLAARGVATNARYTVSRPRSSAAVVRWVVTKFSER